jgi:hypothetical protein
MESSIILQTGLYRGKISLPLHDKLVAPDDYLLNPPFPYLFGNIVDEDRGLSAGAGEYLPDQHGQDHQDYEVDEAISKPTGIHLNILPSRGLPKQTSPYSIITELVAKGKKTGS